MIIRASEIHGDPERARLGAGLAAEALGIKCDLRLQSMWRVEVDGNDREAFLELARECAVAAT
jgi:hypothetical protein